MLIFGEPGFPPKPSSYSRPLEIYTLVKSCNDSQKSHNDYEDFILFVK